MPPKPLVADGLWYCLCPSYKQTPLNRSNRLWPLKRQGNGAVKARSPARTFSSATGGASRPTEPQASSEKDNESQHENSDFELLKEMARDTPGSRLSTRVFNDFTQLPYHLRKVSYPEFLESKLRKTAEREPNYKHTMRLLSELIRRRGTQPQTFHYWALIMANAHPFMGCPKNVRKLLDEMRENNIPFDSATLHAVLKVLAIHPDYLFRQEILRTLRDRWLAISPEGWHNVVTGYIREGQFEMALDQISHMEAQNIPVEQWLYSLLIYNLCDVEDFDMVMELMCRWQNSGKELSPNLWFQVLVTSSECYHEKCVRYVWKERVEAGLLNPPYGVCSNILTMTSRTGNIWLAREVFRVMRERDAIFLLEDYNRLVDTFLAADQLDQALRTLCTAQKAAFKLDESATRSIFTYCIQTNLSPRTLWATLARMKNKEGLNIPPAATNAAIEVAVHHNHMSVALEFYRALQDTFSHRPTATTFNHLIRGCRMTGEHDLANTFVQEMVLLDVFPDRMTYDQLILLCVDAGKFREAHRYFVEMMESGFALTQGSKVHIRTKCFDSEDRYAKLLQYDAEIRKPIARRPMKR
ncbi:hypothetical protein AJ79_09911 [Helicocarpus griseus UAMH5409]|uniref:Pentatricopeptide repeat-containing protein-mitochondrial domain-containing protein n=1 Tax=Helicocarpus griseus UAMH5409 TaxID=1447875 RepID=A0A2B7W850_9EURO|nr:hypothetical protein AJ79_09911 [Helicocarpus griseus UAMH5409]